MPHKTEQTPKGSSRSVYADARESSPKIYCKTDRHTHNGLSKTTLLDVSMVVPYITNPVLSQSGFFLHDVNMLPCDGSKMLIPARDKHGVIVE